jgi:hypothetical protein
MEFGISGGTSLLLQQFLAVKNIPVSTQAPYSPDHGPNDFAVFATLKVGLKRTRLTTIDGIKLNVVAERTPVLPTMA